MSNSYRALGTEIDEATWSGLYSITYRSFDRPKASKEVAVKVVSHYSDEVAKFYEVK